LRATPIVHDCAEMPCTISLKCRPRWAEILILAAAIAGHTGAIDSHQTVATHSDNRPLNQFERCPCAALATVRKMRARLNRPPHSAAELIATLQRQAPAGDRGAPAPDAGLDPESRPQPE
jgi:hypothetical protein